MHRRIVRSRIVAGLAVSAVVALGVAPLEGINTASAVSPKIVSHRIDIQPLYTRAFRTAGKADFGCQLNPISGVRGPRCYEAWQIRNAYGVSHLLRSGFDGTGETIAIIDAYQNPYLHVDLKQFDELNGLSAPDLTQVAPLGRTPFDGTDPSQVDWAGEITLDVQWAHAIAPGAKILLALAPSSDDTALLKTARYVVKNNLADVITQSFGENESCADPALVVREHNLFAQAKRKGMTVFASSGDSGASQFNCAQTGAVLAASTPPSDPLVTGVGGTTLNAPLEHGGPVHEVAWNEIYGCNPPATDSADSRCSGGGFSTIYGRPSWQRNTPHTVGSSRGVPDVSYNAGVNGGVLTHCGVCNVQDGFAPSAPIFFLFGGTSAGSPQWAAITAIGDQMAGRRLGFINPALYKIAHRAPYRAAFRDIVKGNNYIHEIGTGYPARHNWDAVTGLGSPNASRLLPALIRLTE